MIRIVIADDQSMFRDGIKLILEQDSEIKVIGCAADGQEAFRLCKTLMPDMVLLDMVMPVCDGIEATRLIRESFHDMKIVILTTYTEEEKIHTALQMGSDGYVFKDMESDELILTIKSIAKGLKVLHKNAFGSLLNQANTAKEPQRDIVDYHLTERELELIKLLVCGKSYKEIASALFLSEGSVRNIVSVILSKLQVKDRMQLAIFAVRNNIV